MSGYQRYDPYFENDLDVLSTSIYDDDLIPILDREDDSDLSHYESSRCSSLSNKSSEWTCPLKYPFSPSNCLFNNVANRMPRAPPPTPLPTSPNVLPRFHNEQDGAHLEVPALELGTSLKELDVCTAMGNQMLVTKPWWGITSVEDSHFYNVGDMFKRIPESCSLSCSFCDLPTPSRDCEDGESSHLYQTAVYGQIVPSPIDRFGEEHKTVEPQLYQFPPLNFYHHPCSPPPPPPSACSNRSSFDDDQEEITLYSFLRQPYSMIEIDYQLQLLFIQQQAEHVEEHLVDFMTISEINRPKRGGRLRKASRSSIEKAGEALKRKISNAIKRSLSR